MVPSREVRDCCLDDTSWNDAWARLLAASPGPSSGDPRSPDRLDWPYAIKCILEQ